MLLPTRADVPGRTTPEKAASCDTYSFTYDIFCLFLPIYAEEWVVLSLSLWYDFSVSEKGEDEPWA